MKIVANKRGRPTDPELAARRRKEICGEAARFFAEFGYPQADLQVLADRLGVGKGTLYRYFPSKEDLFTATVDAGIQELSAQIDTMMAGDSDPVNLIRRGVLAYLGYFDRHPELVELLIIERAEFRDRKQSTYFVHKERNNPKRRAFLLEAMRAGVVRTMPVERIIEIFNDTLYGAIFTNHFSGRKISFKKQAEDLLEVLLTGILADDHRSPKPSGKKPARKPSNPKQS